LFSPIRFKNTYVLYITGHCHSCYPSRTVPVAALPSPSPELILLYISCVSSLPDVYRRCRRAWLTPLGFQLRHPRLRGLKGFPVDAHQLKAKQSVLPGYSRLERAMVTLEPLILPRRLPQVS